VASIIKKLINGILGDVVQLDHSAQDIDDTITKTSQLTGPEIISATTSDRACPVYMPP
jgi:hypothetical protein